MFQIELSWLLQLFFVRLFYYCDSFTMFVVSSFLLQRAIGNMLQVAIYKQEERAFQMRRNRFIENDGFRNQDFSSLRTAFDNA
jgi:hypothetical protein